MHRYVARLVFFGAVGLGCARGAPPVAPLDQVEAGVAVRMAVLYLLIGATGDE